MMVAIMIRRTVLAAAMLGLVVGVADRAKADPTFTFDDVTIPTGQTSVLIPNGYEGLNWSNFSVANTDVLTRLDNVGVSGVVSPNQAAFNADAGQATITGINRGTFNMLSLSDLRYQQPSCGGAGAP